MRRMNLITSRMIEDALNAYFEGAQKVAEEIIQRDEEVDRLFFLIVRELRSAVQYPRMSELMKITPVEALDYRLAAQYIERIADLAVDSLDGKLVKKLRLIGDKVKEMLSDSVNNLFKFDPKKVTRVTETERWLIQETAKLRQEIVTSPNGRPQTQLYVVDSLLRMGEGAKDITDLALPHN
jgi:phosphate uptake regulator